LQSIIWDVTAVCFIKDSKVKETEIETREFAIVKSDMILNL
jgi:hypothetical protein